jgi:hypothetical protein
MENVMTVNEFLDELKNLPAEFTIKKYIHRKLIRFDIPSSGYYNVCPICAVYLNKVGWLYTNWQVDIAARKLHLESPVDIIRAADGLESNINKQMTEILAKKV